MKYPKINSLWKRVDSKYELVEGDYSTPEFGNIKKWQVGEKIDGTNIRIEYETNGGPDETAGCFSRISFKGRTDEAMIPKKLDNYLRGHFTHDRLKDVFAKQEEEKLLNITLFGEGYGAGIQSGGNYRPDQGFILFDVLVDKWWLKREDVEELAKKLEIPVVPFIGIMTEEEIVAYVKSKPLSIHDQNEYVMEGVIAKPVDLLLLRNGERVIFKLKCRDFK